MKLKRSPLAPDTIPDPRPLAGLEMATLCTGTHYKGRDDLWLASLCKGAKVSGVFTRSATRSAAVDICRDHLTGKEVRAILVNAGNANAFTGIKGREAAERCVRDLAKELGIAPKEVFIASTGVIGEVLPDEAIRASFSQARVGLGRASFRDAVKALSTTDTFEKLSERVVDIQGQSVRLVGIAKGSGMIAPDMATMLAFLFTDARLPKAFLQKSLKQACNDSFNAITVDGDTSTSDTVLLVSTCKVELPPLDDTAKACFVRALKEICQDLAKQIVRDGEGASKFITVNVKGAESPLSARRVAMAVANSPLVKTAIAGEDANWGRVVMAVGKAGEPADRDQLSVSMAGVEIARNGEGITEFDSQALDRGMKAKEIEISVDLNLGTGEARVWTCDLTHGYITINGDYRS